MSGSFERGGVVWLARVAFCPQDRAVLNANQAKRRFVEFAMMNGSPAGSRKNCAGATFRDVTIFPAKHGAHGRLAP